MNRAVIGQPLHRSGGRERVTGAQRYVGDIKLPNLLHTKLVHLDCARARVMAVDTQEASRVDGVVAVFTEKDLPSPVPRFGPAVQDRPPLAVGETKFHGEPVAIVAAETEDAAELAASLVRVKYEQLPPVLTVDQALDPASDLVQDPAIRKDDPFARTNTHNEWDFGWGDVDAAEAGVVVENCYTFPLVTHFAMEPFTFMAVPETGGMTIWSATQNPNAMQRTIAAMLDLPLSKVRVVAPDPGGGFGGKQHPKFEPLLALLARRTGRPVRLALTLEESFQAVRRAGARVQIRTGAAEDGRIVFQDIVADFLIGAYVDIAGRVVAKAAYVAAGPYRVPNVRIKARALFSHTTPSTAFRGLGIPQTNWALEAQLDEIARRLGIDRVDIRLRNLPERGEEFIPGEAPADGIWKEALQKAATAVDWWGPLPGKHGRGIAMGLKVSATTAASYSVVRLHYDGSATVLSGTSDMGQGARTVFSQIAAQELGIPFERIAVVSGDTAVVPFDLQTSASRSTVFMGNAVLYACHDINRQLREYAADYFNTDQSDVTVEGGVVKSPVGTLTVEELLAARFGKVKGEVIGVGIARAECLPDHPLGGKPSFYELMATAVELFVDEETGDVTITRLVNVGDVGKALNPQHVEMQDDGAAVMGLGHSLMEHLILDKSGRTLNLGALDYRIPTTKDIPLVMQSILVENGDGPGPYGAKGCGESGILCTASAVGSAVTAATGVVIRDLPLTPERIWRALSANRRGDGAESYQAEGR